MKREILTMLGIFFVMIVFFCFSGSTQENKQSQQKMMEAYMKMMALNENHAYLKNFVGKWNVETQAWMQPGAEPFVGQNSSKAELIMGGRFLKMRFKGVMFGRPFEGLQIVGYDNLQKKYISFWIDNSSTAFYLSKGVRDEKENVVTETGLWPDPMTDGAIKVRTTTKMVSKDEFIFELYMSGPDGKEFKTLENRSKRIK